MTHFELFNQVKDMDNANEIKMVIKQALLEELAGEDFSVKQTVKKDETKAKINSEYYKAVKAKEKDGKQLSPDEKKKLKEDITAKYSK